MYDDQFDIAKIESQLTDPEQDKLTLEQFLNLSKNAVLLAKSDIPEVKDQICRYLFLNLTVDNEKVASYRLKPPFDAMLKTRLVTPSRVRATTIELCKPLADALITNWDYTKFDNRLLDMAFLIQSQNQYNVMYEH